MARIVTRNNLDSDYFEFDEDAKKIRPTGFAGHKEFGFDLDQIQARINAAQGLPAPSWHHEFGGGASILDPRVTFSRSTPAWYFDKQGVLREAEMDEPVFENGVLRLEAQATNRLGYSVDMTTGSGMNIVGGSVDLVSVPEFDWDVSRFIEDDSYGRHYAQNQKLVSLTTDPVVVWAIVKPINGTRYISVGQSAPTSKANRIVVDCQTLAYETTLEGSVTQLANGWLGVATKHPAFQSSGGAARPTIGVFDGFGVTDQHTGTGTRGFLAAHLQVEDGAVPTSPIFTHGSFATRAADNFAFEGTAFQEAFNPQSGALVFKVGEGSGAPKATIGPLDFTDIQAGGAIALAWRGGDISVFKDGALDDTIYEDLSAAASLEFESIRLRSVSLYDHRPTDEQLEALTS